MVQPFCAFTVVTCFLPTNACLQLTQNPGILGMPTQHLISPFETHNLSRQHWINAPTAPLPECLRRLLTLILLHSVEDCSRPLRSYPPFRAILEVRSRQFRNFYSTRPRPYARRAPLLRTEFLQAASVDGSTLFSLIRSFYS